MLCRENGALHISDVRKEDSSNYILKVLMKSGIEKGWKVPLQVFGEFGEPRGKSPFWAPYGPVGGFLVIMGALPRGEDLRTGLIHFSWSQFLGEILGQQNPNR